MKASGDIIVIQDADLEYDPSDYPRLLRPIVIGEADVVYGSRFASSGRRYVDKFWHTKINKFITGCCNILTNTTLTDVETCYKAFKKDLLRFLQLRENRFGIEIEITIKLARLKPRIYEVPISYRPRTALEGKKISWRDGIRALYCIAKYGLSYWPREENSS